MLRWLLSLARSLNCSSVEEMVRNLPLLAPADDSPSLQLGRLERASEYLQMGLLHLPPEGISATHWNCVGSLLHPRTLDWLLRARTAEEEAADRSLGREEWLRAVDDGMEFPALESTSEEESDHE